MPASRFTLLQFPFVLLCCRLQRLPALTPAQDIASEIGLEPAVMQVPGLARWRRKRALVFVFQIRRMMHVVLNFMSCWFFSFEICGISKEMQALLKRKQDKVTAAAAAAAAATTSRSAVTAAASSSPSSTTPPHPTAAPPPSPARLERVRAHVMDMLGDFIRCPG